MAENNIELKNIRSLSGMKFFIPDYQRGYRWSKTQALQMLNDFKEFYTRIEDDEVSKGEFYCMQPIVVKPRGYDENGNVTEYIVIDGQQRLTTIYILLKKLFAKIEKPRDFELYSLTYETRSEIGTKAFLENIGEDNSLSNQFIDFYYMKIVYDSITEWFDDDDNYGAEHILKNLLFAERPDKNTKKDIAHNIRVIWYEVLSDDDNTTDIDIFTRLNIGKIPLTNAELIKALFLRSSNFGKIDRGLDDKQKEALRNEISLRQLQISEEWNKIEQALQDDAFWYFLRHSSDKSKYETRIEFIFDLMMDRNDNDEFYHTFNKFSEAFDVLGDNAMVIEWNKVKEYFRELEYWYSDRRLFHLIGFLIESGMSIADIKKISLEKDENGKPTGEHLSKREFLKAVKAKIKEYMADVDLDKITYGHQKMRLTLLLFNILTVAESDRADIRFSFDKYKKENWDKEHIASATDHNETPTTKSDQIKWLNDLLLYFVGLDASDYESTPSFIEACNIELEAIRKESDLEDEDELQKLAVIEKLIEATSSSEGGNNNDGEVDFKALVNETYNLVQQYFEKDRIEDKDKISNMALLNSSINRSYGNAFFPIKRMFIKECDSRGVFVPIATKNVFLKYYSKHIDNMMYWTESDAKAYLSAIKRTLKEFITIR